MLRLSSRPRPPARYEDTAVLLGMFAYVILVIVDLTTTTVLLRAFPLNAREANGLLAGLIETHGFGALWVAKLGATAFVLSLYAGMRVLHKSEAVHDVADTGLVASCVVQAAVVLVNIRGFVALVA